MTEPGRRALLVGSALVAACGGRTELDAGSLSSISTAGSVQVSGGSGFGGSFGSGGSNNGGRNAFGGRAGAASGGVADGGGGSTGTGGGAGAASGGAAGATDWYVDPLHGSDQNSGSFGAPFKTLQHASEAARDNQTVWLFDGIYEQATEPRFAALGALDCTSAAGVAFASNVQVRALNSGQPHLLVSGQHGLCLSGGEVQGLAFECEQPGGRIVEVLSGVETIQESSFSNCGSTSDQSFTVDDAAIYVTGDARVTLSPGILSDYSGDPNYSLATVRDTATLTVNGGTVSSLHRAFAAGGSAKLDIEGVQINAQSAGARADQAIAVVDGAPTVIVGGGSAISNYEAAIRLGEANVDLSIDQSTVSDSTFGVFARRASGGNLRGSITHSRFTNVGYGILLYPFSSSVDLSLSDVDFTTGSGGLLTMLGGRLSLTDVTITGFTYGAVISAYSPAAPLSVSVRRVSVTHCLSGGLSLSGHDSTLFDLGTVTSPGGNVVTGNQLDGSASASNLYFYSSAPILISAIGNSWDPNLQGTDESGKCSVVGAAQTFELTNASGANFSSLLGNQAILRLAEQGP